VSAANRAPEVEQWKRAKPMPLPEAARKMSDASEELCAAAFDLREAMTDLAQAAARTEQTIGNMVEMQMRRTTARVYPQAFGWLT